MTASVLIVDDEEKVRSALRRDLEMLDCRVHLADSATAALDVLRRQPVDVIICDQEMPGMSGTRLLQLLRQEHPEVVRVMLTGHATVSTAAAAINQGEIFRFIEKPWDDQELKLTVLQACRKRAAPAP
jgi:DNA-binding NtrC family response regulator